MNSIPPTHPPTIVLQCDDRMTKNDFQLDYFLLWQLPLETDYNYLMLLRGGTKEEKVPERVLSSSAGYNDAGSTGWNEVEWKFPYYSDNRHPVHNVK